MKNKILIPIVFSLVLILPFISYTQDKQINTQTDSVNVLVLQNKYNPEKIEILKSRKRVNIKLKSAYSNGKKISIRGKLTAITDTNIVIDNKYVVNLGTDSISDFRFNNYPYDKALSGTAGIIFFFIGGSVALVAEVTPHQSPGIAVFFGCVAISGGIMIGNTLTKNKHPANSWNISIKRVKKHK